MIRASGIGTVIANLIPRLMRRRPNWHFRLLGDTAALRAFPWAEEGRLSLVPFRAPIYSIREQAAWPVGATKGCDLIWVPHYNIPLRWRGCLVATVHDVAHLALPDIHSSLLKGLYARAMFRLVRRRADGIVFVSRFSAEEFERLVGRPAGHARVVLNGVDDAWFGVEPGVPVHQRPYILFVGNVKPHKNLVRLLEAFDAIADQVPHDLLIVGRKEGFISGDSRVLDMAERYGGRIVFTGFVEQETLRRYVAQAATLVLPSYYEGFGLPPLEAMAVGCPALVSRDASMPEACGDAALYFDPFDVADIAAALKSILTDDALRASLRDKGREHAATLTWDRAADGYIAAFEEVMSRPRRGVP